MTSTMTTTTRVIRWENVRPGWAVGQIAWLDEQPIVVTHAGEVVIHRSKSVAAAGTGPMQDGEVWTTQQVAYRPATASDLWWGDPLDKEAP